MTHQDSVASVSWK